MKVKGVLSVKEAALVAERLRKEGKRIVFTNGCFDILHAGHVHYLNECKKLGDVLFVGINDDSSVRRLKGNKRPIIPLEQRAFVLSNLKAVDFVVPFSEDTPLNLIKAIRPDVLVKGGDWNVEKIVGREFVLSYGGRVLTVPFEFEISTTRIVKRIVERYCGGGDF